MTTEIKEKDLSIRYTVEDDGRITTMKLSLKQIENGDLYAELHNSEDYTCLAKIVKREVIMDEGIGEDD